MKIELNHVGWCSPSPREVGERVACGLHGSVKVLDGDARRVRGVMRSPQSLDSIPLQHPSPLPLSPLRRGEGFLYLLVLLLTFTGCTKESSAGTEQFPNAPVIIISIDTLRSDRLPPYGYSKVQTPAIDSLAADGIVFERAYSNVPLTLPSHTTILTGLLPPTHGVRNNLGYRYESEQHPPITKALSAAGYDTGAAVSCYVLRGNTGLAGAFDFYDDAIASESGVAVGRLQRAGMDTLAVATRWIAERGERPFFLLFHLFEPHGPYEAPEPFRSRFADPYDAEIAASDDVVGRLIQDLKSRKLYDRSLIILLSDHGEGLGDHGEAEHGVFLYREALQVPLIIKLPDSKDRGQRVAEPVTLADIAPTIAALTGVSLPATEGVNVFDETSRSAQRPLYAETLYPRIHLGLSELRSLISGTHHYIEAPRPELYDVVSDPGERRNILEDQRRVFASMRKQMAAFDTVAEAPANVDPEEAARLAALGYVGSVGMSDGPLPDPKDHVAMVETLQRATRLMSTGDHDQAATLLRSVLETNPRFADAWSTLGSVYEGMGRYEDALSAYREGIKVAPTSSAEFALSMTGVLLQLDRFDEARKHAELALERNPAGAHQFLARIALEEKDFAAAEREARAAMVDEAARPRAMVTLAQVRAEQGRLGEAVKMLEETRQDVTARRMRVEHLELALGDVYARMGRLADAEEAFKREIGMFPGNLTAWSNLGVVLVLQKKYDAVDPLFESMAKQNPSRRAYFVAAESYEALGDAKTAAMWRARAR